MEKEEIEFDKDLKFRELKENLKKQAVKMTEKLYNGAEDIVEDMETGESKSVDLENMKLIKVELTFCDGEELISMSPSIEHDLMEEFRE